MNHPLTVPIVIAAGMIAGAILIAPNVSPDGRRLERIRTLCEQIIPADAGGGLSGPRPYVIERCISSTLNFSQH